MSPLGKRDLQVNGFVVKIKGLSRSADRYQSLFVKHISFCSIVCFSIFVLIWLWSGNALAHVSADSMPDSVAEVEYSIYLEFKPNDLKVRNKLGMVYYRLGKIAEAEKQFSMILKKEPDNYDALDGMGLVKAAGENYDEAIQLHRRAMELNPDDMMVYYHLGHALEKKNILREAVEAYRISLEKYNKQYPSGTENKNAAEFADTVKAAIKRIESKL